MFCLDYGNEFVSPGCEKGNCLRSHVNKTETENALAMITKAGVPASKVVVGVTSYARSFGMKDPKCTDPMCTFTGTFNKSTAEAGQCTNTRGYISNVELMELSDMYDEGYTGYEVKRWYDKDSDSDIMVYGSGGELTSWAGWMTDETKKRRIDWITDLNFGGVVDWAIDLGAVYDGPKPDDNETGFGFWDVPDVTCNPDKWPLTLGLFDKYPEFVPGPCRAQAILKLLVDELGYAVDAYNEASEGFDDKFKYYAEWVKDNIDPSLQTFMRGNGTDFMDCKWYSNDREGDGPCTEMELNEGGSASQRPDIGVTYTVRDEDGFYKKLSEDTGILKEWIYWKDKQVYPHECPCTRPPCGSCGSEVYTNYPRAKDYDEIDVVNPKELVDKAVPSTSDLEWAMVETYIEMVMGGLDADEDDVVTAFSMPVFMLQDSADQIAEIKKIGAEVEEAKKKEMIMNIISIVLVVIPFVGEATAALGGAVAIARAAFVIGEVGNTALSIYEIVDNPESAPFAILGIIGTASTIRATGARQAFSKAAGARRALSADKMKAFGDTFVKKDAQVQRLLKSCSIK